MKDEYSPKARRIYEDLVQIAGECCEPECQRPALLVGRLIDIRLQYIKLLPDLSENDRNLLDTVSRHVDKIYSDTLQLRWLRGSSNGDI